MIEMKTPSNNIQKLRKRASKIDLNTIPEEVVLRKEPM